MKGKYIVTMKDRKQHKFHTFGEQSDNPMGYIKKRILSFRYAFQGIETLFRETPNAMLQLIAAAMAVILGFTAITPLVVGFIVFLPKIILLLS